MWNKQRKDEVLIDVDEDEVLIDVDDVALGHQTRMRWNDRDTWGWSTDIVQEPLIGVEDFQTTQDLLAAAGRRSVTRKPRRSSHEYALSGLMVHSLCDRRMQGSWNNGKPHYRCTFPEEYALANQVEHPRSVYVREELILPHLDAWLATAFDAPRLADTIRAMQQSQDPDERQSLTAEQARLAIKEADANWPATGQPSSKAPTRP